MDQIFPPGSNDQKTYLPVFVEGMRMSAEAQSKGRGPDSCSAIRRGFADFPWPALMAGNAEKKATNAPTSGANSATEDADCRKIPAGSSISQCLQEILAKETASINEVYKRYQAQLSSSEREQLRLVQRAWISFRDQDCAFYAAPVKQGSTFGVAYSQCQIEHTRQRRQALKAYLSCREGTTPGKHCGS